MFEPHPPLLQSSSIIARVDIWLSITSRQTSFIASLHHPSSSTVIASMASHSQPMPLPIRTNTVDSQKSQSSSGQISPPYSPASPNSRLATSPTEESFFGAITARIRGRSRSRSRGATPDKRTKSPMSSTSTCYTIAGWKAKYSRHRQEEYKWKRPMEGAALKRLAIQRVLCDCFGQGVHPAPQVIDGRLNGIALVDKCLINCRCF
jgi:hypothetical protein